MTTRTSSAESNCIYYYSYLSFRFLYSKDAYSQYSFDANQKPLPIIPPLLESIKEALDNRILAALAIAAFITMITGTINDFPWGWANGFSIYVGIFFIVAFTALNDWAKDKNFVKLASEVKKDHIGVIRGKIGVTQTLSIYKLVVGDIVLLEPGCIVPADCVLISGEDINVDEMRYSDDRVSVKKTVANESNIQRYG